MKKTNFRSITLTALILVLALMLSLAVGSLMPSKKASAVTYTPSTIFSAGTGGSVSASEKDEDGNSYVQFTFSEGGAVYFRRDLALKWYESAATENDGAADGETTEDETDSSETQAVSQTKGALKYLSFGFSFDGLQFSTFSLTFESAEENISKDSTSTNTVVFKNDGEGVKAAVRNSSQQEDEEWEENAEFVPVEVGGGVLFTVNEENCDIGEFAVYVNGEYVGKLTNIGGYYLEYLSSASSTPRIPIAFVADGLTEGASEQRILIKELNGQSFKLDENGKVVDNAAPVLVLNEKVYAYILGKKWSLTYSAIDVCDTSVTVSRYYYMMKTVDGAAQNPKDDDYSSLTTSTFFMPADDSGEQEEQYVSIRFQLTDDSGVKDDGDGYVYLVWYAAENAVATMGEGDRTFDYILVNRNEEGPYYYGVTADETTKTNIASEEAKEEAAKFQEAVTAAAEGLSAGEGSYFYVPSLRGLIKSDHADYRNLTFTVYYYKQSSAVGAAASSAASLSYNSLKFEIDEIGLYLFCVLATDASGNGMMYYVDHELVAVTSSNIWDIDEIPKFQFSVSYTGATVEDPGEQSLGYRDSTYSVSSFDIVALSGYETEYSLYYLDEAAMQRDGVSVPFSSYSDLVTNIKDYYVSLEKYLVSINEYNSSITEDDAWDRTDNEYYWYPDSLSFMPVNVGYYVVKLTITEASLPGNVVTAYQVIDVRNPIDSPPDSTYWLQNNVTSVVLFSISAVLAIVIVILFVVKPADKTVDEVDLSKLKKMESRKKGVLGKTEKKEEEDK